MEFDIIIATRNRQMVLPISIPLMLSQNRLPRQFIIVDSSDNHNEVKYIVEKTVCNAHADIDLLIIQSEPSSSHQRNIGLKYAKSPVVIFPDDDSLWSPGVAESIMKIYEKDEENLIGGVCATESSIPPPGVFGNMKPVYHMEFRDRLQGITGSKLRSIEDRLFPDPLFLEGTAKPKQKKIPSFLHEEKASISGPMTGFRMSFRRQLIDTLRFDEILGRYSLFEDRDASLGVMQNHIIARAGKALVFHYRAPEERVNGIEWGMMHILNRAYVVCKHSKPGSRARRLLKRYLFYKLARYILQAQTNYGRQRVLGAWRAISQISYIINSPKDDLPKRYIEVRNNCIS